MEWILARELTRSLFQRRPLEACQFSASVRNLIPMSGNSGKEILAKKIELSKRIADSTRATLEEARTELLGKRVDVQVCFYLWKGDASHTDTVRKKDLDNLLKLLFDSLQVSLDPQKRIPGVGIMNSDDDVFHVEATKKIVDSEALAGIDIRVSEFRESQSKAV